MDFLPSYFESGMRIMVTSQTDVGELMGDVFKRILQSILYLVVGFVFMTMLLFPFVWVLEMLNMSKIHGLPIFISRRELAEKTAALDKEWNDIHGDSFHEEKTEFVKSGRQQFIEFQSIVNAMKWTAFLLMGSKVSYPAAPVGSTLRGTIC